MEHITVVFRRATGMVEAVFTTAALAEQFILSRKTPEKFRYEVMQVYDSLAGATLFHAPPEIEMVTPI